MTTPRELRACEGDPTAPIRVAPIIGVRRADPLNASRWSVRTVFVGLVMLGVLVAAGVQLTAGRVRSPRFQPPAGSIYLGVSTDVDRLDTFDSAAGITGHPALFGRWTTPDGAFQPILDQTVNRPGLAPIIHWNLPLDGYQVTSGRQDAYLGAQAKAVKAYAKPTFIRLDWEFNAETYPRWNMPAVSAAQYIASWRHVVSMFSDVPNVAFVWSPTTWPGPGGNRVAAWWPGDAFVDWVGLDAYPQRAGADYLLHGPDGMDDMAAFAGRHHKPLMLAEWAPDLPHPDQTAAVALIFDWAASHKDVQALVYFDFVTQGKDYTLAHHPVGAAEFRRRTRGDPRFLLTVRR